MTPLLSVVIPTFNTCSITIRCIEQIFAHPPSHPFEIIVVDNDSKDGTADAIRLRFPKLKFIQNETNVGFSKACNQGAAESQGRYLLFLNSDTEAQPGTFDSLMRWLDQNPTTGIVGPMLTGPDGKILQMSWVWNPILFWELLQQYFAPYAVRRSPFRQSLIRFLQRRSKSVPSICGACLMIRRSAFDHVGGFDENFELYFEDSDLCFRCREQGWRIDFVSESAIVHHLGRSTRGQWNSTSLIYQQSHIAYYKKHSLPGIVWLLKGYLLAKWMRLRFVSTVDKRDHGRSSAYCRAYLRMVLFDRKVTLQQGVPN